MLFSILMPYWNRAPQFENTLDSFRELYYGIEDYEIIIIEDKKNWGDKVQRDALDRILALTDIPIVRIRSEHVGWNPAPLYNQGAEVARGEYLIITNPECLHTNDILGGLEEEFKQHPDSYILCGCQSWRGGKFHRWFQHSEHHNKMFHFCSAMSKETYWKLGGFDEEFGPGYGYEDDDLRDRILAAGIPIIYRDDLMVIHQQHPKQRPRDYTALHSRNRQLWFKKHKTAKVTFEGRI